MTTFEAFGFVYRILAGDFQKDFFAQNTHKPKEVKGIALIV